MLYRYYSTQRPLGPGCCPRSGIAAVVNFDVDFRIYCSAIGRAAWGYVDYTRPLTEKEVADYELTQDVAFNGEEDTDEQRAYCYG